MGFIFELLEAFSDILVTGGKLSSIKALMQPDLEFANFSGVVCLLFFKVKSPCFLILLMNEGKDLLEQRYVKIHKK